MMIIIGFILTALFFGGLGFVFGKKAVSNSEGTKLPKSNKVDYIRRGIWSNGYSSQGSYGKDSFDVQFELGELESTSTKSKVFVISMVASKSEFNNDNTKQRLSEMVNNTWMLSSDIEWIDDTSKMRNDKIDQILNS